MQSTIQSTELLQACLTLFGPQIDTTHSFLEYLQPTGLKSAYRRRALETHPDRAKAVGKIEVVLNEEFKNVKRAYEILSLFVENGRTKTVFKENREDTKRSRQTETGYRPPADHIFTGNIPKRKLMFGQFLYYSGIISWNKLIEAIIWQRRQRPKIGEIAIQWRLLSTKDIIKILVCKNYDEKFAECAMRMGFLTNFQKFALIAKQKRIQQPIGKFFVENNIITPEDALVYYLNKHKEHNRKIFRCR